LSQLAETQRQSVVTEDSDRDIVTQPATETQRQR